MSLGDYPPRAQKVFLVTAVLGSITFTFRVEGHPFAAQVVLTLLIGYICYCTGRVREHTIMKEKKWYKEENYD